MGPSQPEHVKHCLRLEICASLPIIIDAKALMLLTWKVPSMFADDDVKLFCSRKAKQASW